MKIYKMEDEIHIYKSGKNKGKRVYYYCDNCNNIFSCFIPTSKLNYFLNNEKRYCKKCSPKFSCISRNKTYEEMYGKEKAKKLKLLRSQKNPGKLRKGKTNIEYYGKEKAKEISKKHSISIKGEKNSMYGKPSPQGSGNGWCGWYKNYFFRSILELSFIINYIEKNNYSIKSAEYLKIPYIFNNTKRNYLPDYIDEQNKILYEIKPYHLIKSKENQAKFASANIWCTNNKYNFKILSEYNFSKFKTSDIIHLRKNNLIKFIDRYEKMFKEKYG